MSVELLVIGAGPYGVSVAAYAKSLGVNVMVVGKPLDLWKTNMPRGMYLRSAPDWQLDGRKVATFDKYLTVRGLAAADVKPLPLDVFLDYAAWFMGQYDVTARPNLVTRLQRVDDEYQATLDDGTTVRARQVVLALGYAQFKYVPPELVAGLPPEAYAHTSDAVDFEYYRGKRVLIVGGRQSAFEWAALMHERGAEEIYICHRHATPEFREPQWDWVLPMAERTLHDHGWWRALTPDEQEKIRYEFWTRGRQQLEEWLGPRVCQPNIHIHANTLPAQVSAQGDGTYAVTLENGAEFSVHHIIFATGYRPDFARVGLLDRASIREQWAFHEGLPELGTEFQTSLPNLYVTGMGATRDFGPFFGFTVASPVSAQVIGEAIVSR